MSDLIEKIEVCRKKLYQLSLEKPLTSKEMVLASKELDHLLNQLDNYFVNYSN